MYLSRVFSTPSDQILCNATEKLSLKTGCLPRSPKISSIPRKTSGFPRDSSEVFRSCSDLLSSRKMDFPDSDSP